MRYHDNHKVQERAVYNRRSVLRLMLGIAGTWTLAACGGKMAGTTPTSGVSASTPKAVSSTTISSTPTRGPAVTPSTGGAVSVPAATGTPSSSGVVPSPAPGVPPAYLKYPPKTFKSVNSIPGEGGPLKTVSTLEINYSPPVKSFSQNKYWQELNKRLGVKLDVQLVPADNFLDKFATIAAGGDIPALTWLWNGEATPVQLLQQGAFTDLTDYLSGDGLKEYPNLARIPSKIWQNARFAGKLYGVPRPRSLVGGSMMWRQDWAQKLGYSQIKSTDDFEKCVVAMTKNDPDGDKKSDTWGLSSWSGDNYGDVFMFYIFRVPNQWQVSKDGTFTYYAETPEYKQALQYARKLYKDGVYYPDTASQSHQKCWDGFASGKYGGFGMDAINSLEPVAGSRLPQQTKQSDPKADVAALMPPGHDGDKAITWNGSGFFGYTGIPTKVGKDEKAVKELLRILDYLAAPFGSEEYVFVNYGIKGWDYNPGPDGGPVLTDTGLAEIGDLPRGLANAPRTIYFPQDPQGALSYQKVIKDMLAVGVDNPSNGLYSETAASKSATITQKQSDMETGVISGREPVSSIGTFQNYWRQNGGEQIRKEYEQAYQKAQKS